MKRSDDASSCYEVVLRHMERAFGENGELLNQSISPALKRRFVELLDKIEGGKPLTDEELKEFQGLRKDIFA